MNKPKALFLPGLLNDTELWDHQVRELSDLVSPVVADLTKDSSIKAMASRALETVDGPFILISLSMGGYVAFEILRQAQERVAAVALMSTSASPDEPERASERKRAISSLELGKFRGVTERFLPRLIHSSKLNSAVGTDIRKMALRVGEGAFLNQQRAILRRKDFRPLLGQISAPTLVAVGDSDQLTPPCEAKSIRDGIPHAMFHEFKNCGHLPPMECPVETVSLLRDWLTNQIVHEAGTAIQVDQK